ncbi:cell wall-binding repeat-containing protein [Curtobacterium sp. RRHDQ10]|uniref:cell wall-binding repeat-containing protein n=1 Tax=Curtobacterium phyllosphaerae TaxID=3413379 RepID=UPI003BF36EBE
MTSALVALTLAPAALVLPSVASGAPVERTPFVAQIVDADDSATGRAAEPTTAIATGGDGRTWGLVPGGVVPLSAHGRTSTSPGDPVDGELVTGGDGAVWTVDPPLHALDRTDADARTTIVRTGSAPLDHLVATSDGSLVVAGRATSTIVRVAMDHTRTEAVVPGVSGISSELVAAADGRVWFASRSDGVVGYESGSLPMTVTTLPGHPVTAPDALVADPTDGVWATSSSTRSITAVTADGTVQRVDLPSSVNGDLSAPVIVGATVAVTAPERDGHVHVITVDRTTHVVVDDVATGVPAGQTSTSPVLGPDGAVWFGAVADQDPRHHGLVERVAADGVRSFPLRERPRVLAVSAGSLWVGTEDGFGRVGQASTSRTAGADRFATSVALARAAFPTTADVVLVATGANFPDALAAGPAAAELGGPLLLTATDTLPPDVADEIRSLRPTRIIVVGGTAAVTDRVRDALRTVAASTPGGATVERLAGADRFDTNRRLNALAFPAGSATHAWVAASNTFPDALAAGAAAASEGQPVFLADGGTPAPQETISAMQRIGISSVTTVGGSAVIGVPEDTLAASFTVRNASGLDRFETASAVAAAAYPDGVGSAMVATGTSFPDALSSIALAARRHVPLLLARPECMPGPTLLSAASLGAQDLLLVGGPAALSDDDARLVPCG